MPTRLPGAPITIVLHPCQPSDGVQLSQVTRTERPRMRHLARLPLAADGVGTISAEPGVGVATSRWLALTRSPGELQAMAAIKHVLDPDGILNPGVVLA